MFNDYLIVPRNSYKGHYFTPASCWIPRFFQKVLAQQEQSKRSGQSSHSAAPTQHVREHTHWASGCKGDLTHTEEPVADTRPVLISHSSSQQECMTDNSSLAVKRKCLIYKGKLCLFWSFCQIELSAHCSLIYTDKLPMQGKILPKSIYFLKITKNRIGFVRFGPLKIFDMTGMTH